MMWIKVDIPGKVISCWLDPYNHQFGYAQTETNLYRVDLTTGVVTNA